MSYRNKTYVIFDGDNDMWAYAYMLGWKNNEHIEFDFYNAHDLKKIAADASEQTVKRILKERLNNTKQAIVVVGEATKNLYRFVRWEIESCQTMGIPIVVANLNGKRQLDEVLCPPLIRGTAAIHVAFKAKIIQKALDEFCENYAAKYKYGADWRFEDNVYKSLGL
ncbi:hypothetical protein D9599_04340 [Roseomonas sp. KE2513]|uniref:TIR domain-containing protein n=1 Tax=Roseomonas sp. KE2513 TaxID=2479202 RepID=UPI0018DEF9C3|nr:TIR domain-containing protein [Roseomonas sp. KE2513]MBI0534799.1 hypothetical protein [Roseomonas sp. KE2513]